MKRSLFVIVLMALSLVNEVVHADDSSDFTALGGPSTSSPQNAEETPATPSSDVAADAGSQDQTLLTLGRYAGPIILGVSALGSVALGIYALLPSTCSFRAGDGLCLRGEDANPQGGAALLVTAGVLALGALLWVLLIDAPAQETTHVVATECGPWSLCASF